MKKKSGFRFFSMIVILMALIQLVSGPAQAAENDDRLAGTPTELREHVYLDKRGNGDCEKLTGSVMTLFIFVNDAESGWSQSEIDTYLNSIHSQIAEIKQTARSYGKYPEFDVYYTNVYTDEVLTTGGNVNANGTSLMMKACLSNKRVANEELEQSYGTDDAAIFFVMNKTGRACAYSATDTAQSGEYGILFNDPSPFWHELNHLYGAKDFYYPQDIQNAVELYLGQNIMTDSNCHIIDDLTAYLIGWTDELSSCARGFLYETGYLTQAYLNEANRAQSITGWGTVVNNNGTYTGNMIDGTYNGYGVYAWNCGDRYEGDWLYGARTGYGTYTWPDGAVYEGNWLDGQFHGWGKLTYANGTTQAGNYSYGQFIG